MADRAGSRELKGLNRTLDQRNK